MLERLMKYHNPVPYLITHIKEQSHIRLWYIYDADDDITYTNVHNTRTNNKVRDHFFKPIREKAQRLASHQYGQRKKGTYTYNDTVYEWVYGYGLLQSICTDESDTSGIIITSMCYGVRPGEVYEYEYMLDSGGGCITENRTTLMDLYS